MRNRWIAVIAIGFVFTTVVLGQIRLKPPPAQTKPATPHDMNNGTSAATANKNTEPWVVEGKVKDVSDPDDKGIPGAVVQVGGKGSYTTDAYGYYKVDGLDRSKPTYTFRVSKAGYTFNPDRADVHPPNGRMATVNFSGTPIKGKK